MSLPYQGGYPMNVPATTTREAEQDAGPLPFLERPEQEWVPLAELPSRMTTSGPRSHERLDPYWAGMWAPGTQAQWVSLAAARTQADHGLTRLPKTWNLSEDVSWERIRKPARWRAATSAMGYLSAWRAMTSEQLAAFTGVPSFATSTSQMLRLMFSLDLIDIGVFPAPFLPDVARRRAEMIRPRVEAFVKKMSKEMTYAEYLSVTGGRAWRVGRQADRHNVLGAELALRVAEYTSVATVLGETYGRMDMLLGTGLGAEAIRSTASADLVLVRQDGMRVAVEMTGSATPTLREKIDRWVKELAKKSLPACGLTVLFVIAPHPTEGTWTRKETERHVRRLIRESITSFAPSAREQVASRLGVVGWAEWFPAAGFAHPDLLDLTCWRLENTRGESWRKMSLLDPASYPFQPYGPDGTAPYQTVLGNAPMLAAPPAWLRIHSGRPVFDAREVSRALVGAPPCPIPVPSDRRREHLYDAGVPRGSGARVQPNPRLVGATTAPAPLDPTSR